MQVYAPCRSVCPLQDDEERAATRWRVRRPAWLLVERVALDAQWRDSQRAYRPWASISRPAPGFDEVPAPIKVCGDALLQAGKLHAVVHTAELRT